MRRISENYQNIKYLDPVQYMVLSSLQSNANFSSNNREVQQNVNSFMPELLGTVPTVPLFTNQQQQLHLAPQNDDPNVASTLSRDPTTVESDLPPPIQDGTETLLSETDTTFDYSPELMEQYTSELIVQENPDVQASKKLKVDTSATLTSSPDKLNNCVSYKTEDAYTNTHSLPVFIPQYESTPLQARLDMFLQPKDHWMSILWSGSTKFATNLGTIPLWGCVTWYRTGPLFEFDEPILDQYLGNIVNILVPWAKANLPENWRFHIDSDPINTCGKVTGVFSKFQIDILAIPLVNEINPVEYIWGDVKRKIEGQVFKSKQEFYKKAATVWNSVPKNRCVELINRMKHVVMDATSPKRKRTSKTSFGRKRS